MNRKIRKLIRDPKRFFGDARANYAARARSILYYKNQLELFRQEQGFLRYAIVSALFNAEPYLEYFLFTITAQSLDFRRNIKIYLVDDGSTDGSADIIARFQSRYPENIIYLRKENGGQGSARNHGLDFIKASGDVFDFVTFMDPDDFIDPDYFRNVDRHVQRAAQKNISIVSCNFLIYREFNKRYDDSHPLRYRFEKGDRILSISDMQSDLQLSVNSAFFRADLINRINLRFDERIRPTFEDAHFVGLYLLSAQNESISFLASSKYYYRRRALNNSTLNLAPKDKRQYLDVIEFGCIALLEEWCERNDGVVPLFVQRTVLYHLCNYFTWHSLVDDRAPLPFLTSDERIRFGDLLKKAFAFIDPSTITGFELAGLWNFHKYGILNLFKKSLPAIGVIYVEDVNWAESTILVRYFAKEGVFDSFRLGSAALVPVSAKKLRHTFLGSDYIIESLSWLKLECVPDSSILSAEISCYSAVEFTINGIRKGRTVSLADLRGAFPAGATDNSNIWLFIDRDTQADDNAEHMYRYVAGNHPEIEAYFILRRDSHDWERLSREAFNLIEYGSPTHEALLDKCGTIISSHIDSYVVDYFGDKRLARKRFVFLQHGVIHNDISKWLNSKKIDCFITAAHAEFNALVGDENGYKFTKREVVLTGLPRHDELLRARDRIPASNTILVMPTWRSNLTGQVIKGSSRKFNPAFSMSDYAVAWKSFLGNGDLHALLRRHNYRILFYPHANVQPYIEEFDIRGPVDIGLHEAKSIQEAICSSRIMITDYSSIAFEFAYIERPIIYYQFDHEAVFGGSHIFRKGYFDYEEDGFGPVVYREQDLLRTIESLLDRDARIEQTYYDRVRGFFPYRDGECCQRVYKAIEGTHLRLGSHDAGVLLDHAVSAEQAKRWEEAEARWKAALASINFDASHPLHPQMMSGFARSLLEQGITCKVL